MIAPYYFFFVFAIFVPIVASLYYSFTDYNLYQPPHYVGLRNFIALFTADASFLVSVRNTLVYVVFTVIPILCIGLFFAVLLNRKTPGLRVFRSIFFLPRVVSMVTASMVWLWMYDPTGAGMLNAVLQILGLPTQNWLGEPGSAMASIVIMSIWKNVGYTMVIFLAGLQLIPSYLYEAAVIEGAGEIRRFVHITLPLLKPTTFFIFITTMIESFNVFVQVNLLTDGGPLRSTTTIVHQVYKRAFYDFQMGYASAISIVLLAIVALITFVNYRYGSRGIESEY